jgi:RNA binding exosome subunit
LKGPVQSLEVSYFVHATEDSQTLAKAVSALLSVDTAPEEEQMEGHFGNTITRVRYHLTGEEAAAALGSIVARLSTLMKRLVAGTLEEGTGDPVRIKVKPRGFLLHGGAKEFYSKILFGGS